MKTIALGSDLSNGLRNQSLVLGLESSADQLEWRRVERSALDLLTDLHFRQDEGHDGLHSRNGSTSEGRGRTTRGIGLRVRAERRFRKVLDGHDCVLRFWS